MNQTTYVRSRKYLAEKIKYCDLGLHDWCDEDDPITGRTHCRHCTAYIAGHIDANCGTIVHEFGIRSRLGWYPPGHELYHDGSYKNREE